MVTPPSPELPRQWPSRPPAKTKATLKFVTIPNLPAPANSNPVSNPKKKYTLKRKRAVLDFVIVSDTPARIWMISSQEEKSVDSKKPAPEYSSPQLPYKRKEEKSVETVSKKHFKLQPSPEYVSPQLPFIVPSLNVEPIQHIERDVPQLPPPQNWLTQKPEVKEQDLFKCGPSTPEILETLALKEGTVQYRNGTYSGELLELVPHGKGTWRSASGDTYEGDWLNGEMHGQGSCIYANGHYYNGGWKEGLKHGKGVFLFRNGDSYEGDWWNGQMHGKGIGKYAGGDFYQGSWRENNWHGPGTYHFSQGAEYEGDYRKNEKQGKFIIRTPQGSECELEFEDNKPIHGSDRIVKLSSNLQNKSVKLTQISLDRFITQKSS